MPALKAELCGVLYLGSAVKVEQSVVLHGKSSPSALRAPPPRELEAGMADGHLAEATAGGVETGQSGDLLKRSVGGRPDRERLGGIRSVVQEVVQTVSVWAATSEA